MELDLDVGDGEEEFVDDVVVGGVDHHRCRGVGEGAGIDQIDLPAIHLLGRGSEHGDPDAEVLGDRDQGYPGARGGGGDDVVTAGVANLGQRIQLAADHDLRSRCADSCGEGGFQTVRRALHLEAVGTEKLGQSCRRLVLFEGRLRMLIHPPGYVPQLMFHGAEGPGRRIFRGHVSSFVGKW